MKKAPQILAPQRKRSAPRNAFKKGEPNPHAFQPGQSGNAGGMGRPKDPYRLVSRAMRSRLNTRATDAAAIEAGLEPGASWAQVLGVSLINLAIAGDVAAARTVLEYCDQPLPRTARLELSGVDGEPLQPPAINVIVVPRGAQLQGEQAQPAVPRLLPGKRPSAAMLDSDAVARAANAVVAAIAKGAPRTIPTIHSCMPDEWVLDGVEDDDLRQPTSAAHWELVLRARAVPQQ